KPEIPWPSILIVSLCVGCLESPAWGLPKRDQCPTPNSQRIAAYEFLAELAYHRAQAGEYEIASRAAENLEFTWGETSGCFQALGVSGEETAKIDHLMDKFIWPLRASSGKARKEKVFGISELNSDYRRYIDELNSLLDK